MSSNNSNSSQISLTSTVVDFNAPLVSEKSLKVDQDTQAFLRAYGMGGGLSMDGYKPVRTDFIKPKSKSNSKSSKEPKSKDEVASDFISKYGYGFGIAPTPMPASSKASKKEKVVKEKKIKIASKDQDQVKVANDFIATYGLNGSFAPTPLPTSNGSKSSNGTWRKLFTTRET